MSKITSCVAFVFILLISTLLTSCAPKVPVKHEKISTVKATVSPSNFIVAQVNSSRAVSIVFNAINGNATNLSLDLAHLPAGWISLSGNNYNCSTINTNGNGCQANLLFHPSVVTTNFSKLQLTFTYTDNSLISRIGSTIINYKSTANNVVYGTVSPQIPISVATNSSNLIKVTFTTDNGIAQKLSLNLTSLPIGWSSESGNSYNCEFVNSNGNGCQALLRYAPTTTENGDLNLAYTYLDNFGGKQDGIVYIPYSSIASNTISYNAPTQIVSPNHGVATAQIRFNTDTGSASNLNLNLQTMPSGWSSEYQTLNCQTVINTGSNCQAILTFNPQNLLDNGVLSLPYTYTNNVNQTQSGTVTIYYYTTPDNHVHPYPNSENILAPIGIVEPVNIIFTVDAGVVTNFSITNANSFPSGWSIQSNSCTGNISGASPCSLVLSFDTRNFSNNISGAFQVQYSYTNNAKQQISGNIPIEYQTTSNGVILFSPNPVPPVVAGQFAAQSTTITLTAVQGNVSNLSYLFKSTSNGWQPATSNCSTSLTVNQSCEITLLYQPETLTNGIAELTYTYSDEVGSFNGITIPIQYTSVKSIDGSSNKTNPISVLSTDNTNVTITFIASENITNFTPNYSLPSSYWSEVSSTCGSSISVGQPCQVVLNYAPTNTGVIGSFAVSYNFTNSLSQNGTINIPITYSSPTWQLIAGNNTLSGQYSSAAVDPAGNLYIGMQGSIIYMYNFATGTWSTYNSDVNSGDTITALAADGNGNVYPGTEAFAGGTMWQFPGAITLYQMHEGYPSYAYFKNGQIYYADSDADLYVGHTLMTSLPTFAPIKGLTIDSNNNLYTITTTGASGALYECPNTNFNNCSSIDSHFSPPSNVTSDDSGYAYVAWSTTLIKKYLNGAVYSTLPNPSGSFSGVNSIAWDSLHQQLVAGFLVSNGIDQNGMAVYVYNNTGNWINTAIPNTSFTSGVVLSAPNGTIYAVLGELFNSDIIVYKLHYQ